VRLATKLSRSPARIHREVAQITIEDALRLVATQVVGIDDRIERVYLWQFERLMAVVKGAFVIWASLLATLAPAVFGEKVRAEWWQGLTLVTFLFAVGAIGFFNYLRLGRIYLEYVDNLLMLGFARQMTEARV
jgi:hypothetical protein